MGHGGGILSPSALSRQTTTWERKTGKFVIPDQNKTTSKQCFAVFPFFFKKKKKYQAKQHRMINLTTPNPNQEKSRSGG